MDDCLGICSNGLKKWSSRLFVVMDSIFMEICVFFIVIVDCATMFIMEPDLKPSSLSFVLQFRFYVRWIYTVEMCLRMWAQGVCLAPGSYFRSIWTIVDAVVVVSMWAFLMNPLTVPNFSFLRIFRGYKLIFCQDRPLALWLDDMTFKVRKREWYRLTKVLAGTIVQSLTQVAQVVVLLLFIMLMIGVLGINLIGLSDALYSRCSWRVYDEQSGHYDMILAVPIRGCQKPSIDNLKGSNCPTSDFHTFDVRDDGLPLGSPRQAVCVLTEDLPSTAHFCDIGGSAMLVFRAFYTDSWVESMLFAADSVNTAVVFIWLFLVIFGAFYLMSLTVATTALRYGQLAQKSENQKAQDDAEAEREAAKLNPPKKVRSGDDDGSDDDSGEEDGSDNDLDIHDLRANADRAMKDQIRSQPNGSGFACCVKCTSCTCGICGLCADRINGCCFCCQLCPKVAEGEDLYGEQREKFANASKRLFDKVTMAIFLRPTHPKLVSRIGRYTWIELFNTVNVFVWFFTLATKYHNMSKSRRDVMSVSLLIQTGLFCATIGLKYIGHQSMQLYLSNPANVLDVGVVFCVILGDIFSEFNTLSNIDPTFWPLRLLQLAPVLWLMSRIQLPEVMTRVFKNFAAIYMAVVLLLLMIIVFTLLGMELFAAQSFDANSDFSKMSLGGYILVIIMMGDSWAIYAAEGNRTLGFFGFVFFLAYFYVCNFMFLRLFIAIIIFNFELSDEEKLAGQRYLFDQIQKDKEKRAHFRDPHNFDIEVQFDMLNAPNIGTKQLAQKHAEIEAQREEREANRPDRKKEDAPELEAVIEGLSVLNPEPGEDKILSPWQRRRRQVNTFVQSTPVTVFVFVCVILSVVSAVINTPGQPPIVNRAFKDLLDLLLFFVFALEACAKISVQGDHPFSPLPENNPGYFLRRWDQFDFFLLFAASVDTSITYSGSAPPQWLKGLRALRILRVIPRLMRGDQNPLRVATEALGSSMKDIGVIFIMLLAMMFFFSMVAMKLYIGLFYSCNQVRAPYAHQLPPLSKAGCAGTYWEFPSQFSGVSREVDYKILMPRVWDKPALNFDDVSASMQTLYAVLNRGGIAMVTVMTMAMTYVDAQPIENFRMSQLTFTLLFMVMGGTFVSQMVIAIIVNNLRLKSGSGLYTDLQRRWKSTQLMIDSMTTPKPIATNTETATGWLGVRLFMRNISAHPYFEYVMTGVILVNSAFLAAEACGQDAATAAIFFWFNMLFLFMYVSESVTKGLADPRHYFTNFSDVSDMVITMIGGVEIIVNELLHINIGAGVLKMLRLVRVMRKNDQMMQQLRTITLSVGALGASCFLLFVWIFIFSAMASRMFSTVKWGNEIGRQVNFQSLPMAALALFEMASGGDWLTMMLDCGVAPPSCTATPDDAATLGDCGSPGATVFFFLYMFGINYALLPLFIATVITSFYETNSREFSLISTTDLSMYTSTWQKFVRGGTEVRPGEFKMTKMRLPQLWPFVDSLKKNGCVLGNLKRCRMTKEDRMKLIEAGADPDEAFDKVEQQCRLIAQAELRSNSSLDPFDDQNLLVDYNELIVFLSAHLFPAQAVTVVDLLLRERAAEQFDDISLQRPEPPPEAPKKGRGMFAAKDLMYGTPKKKKERMDDDESDDESTDDEFKRGVREDGLPFNVFTALSMFVEQKNDSPMPVHVCKRLHALLRASDETLLCMWEEFMEEPSHATFQRFKVRAERLVETNAFQWSKYDKNSELEVNILGAAVQVMHTCHALVPPENLQALEDAVAAAKQSREKDGVVEEESSEEEEPDDDVRKTGWGGLLLNRAIEDDVPGSPQAEAYIQNVGKAHHHGLGLDLLEEVMASPKGQTPLGRRPSVFNIVKNAFAEPGEAANVGATVAADAAAGVTGFMRRISTLGAHGAVESARAATASVAAEDQSAGGHMSGGVLPDGAGSVRAVSRLDTSSDMGEGIASHGDVEQPSLLSRLMSIAPASPLRAMSSTNDKPIANASDSTGAGSGGSGGSGGTGFFGKVFGGDGSLLSAFSPSKQDESANELSNKTRIVDSNTLSNSARATMQQQQQQQQQQQEPGSQHPAIDISRMTVADGTFIPFHTAQGAAATAVYYNGQRLYAPGDADAGGVGAAGRYSAADGDDDRRTHFDVGQGAAFTDGARGGAYDEGVDGFSPSRATVRDVTSPNDHDLSGFHSQQPYYQQQQQQQQSYVDNDMDSVISDWPMDPNPLTMSALAPKSTAAKSPPTKVTHGVMPDGWTLCHACSKPVSELWEECPACGSSSAPVQQSVLLNNSGASEGVEMTGLSSTAAIPIHQAVLSSPEEPHHFPEPRRGKKSRRQRRQRQDPFGDDDGFSDDAVAGGLTGAMRQRLQGLGGGTEGSHGPSAMRMRGPRGPDDDTQFAVC